MHRALVVPLVALVLVIGSIPFTPPALAQSSSSLEGLVCSQDWQQKPTPDGGDSGHYCMGSGLPGATVTLTQPGVIMGIGSTQHSADTDARGWFRITGVASGDYQLRIERTGFEAHVETLAMQGAKHIEVSLHGQDVAITGHVRDNNGSAIQGAAVSLSGPEHLRLETNAQGRIQATVQAGHYSMQASHPDHRTKWHHQLLDGETEMVLVLEKTPERTATLNGVVRDQDGHPVAGANVQAWQYSYIFWDQGYDESPPPEGQASPSVDPARSYSPYYEDNHQATTTDAQGRFTLKLHAGHVSLNAWKEGHASYHRSLDIADGETRDVAIELAKFPDKTARIVGKVTGPTGDGLRLASITVQSPQYGLYECSVNDRSGASGSGSTGSAGSSGGAAPAPEPMIWYDPDYRSGCAITVHADGTFEGNVTPGYSILRVSYQHWESCSEVRHADGSMTRTCGPDYFQSVQTLNLPANATTRIDVQLRERPGPDATLSGYVVDTQTGQALSGVTLYISNQDNYAWAQATTDGDGSYKVRLRSGFHTVSVYADGYFRWEGTLQVPADRETPFDIHLTPGEEAYGHGCCYPMPFLRSGADGAHDMADSAPASSGFGAEGTQVESSTQDFEDLRGGLGPYDPAKRAQLLAEGERGIPGPGLVLVAGLLAGLVLAVRRHRL